VTADMQTSIRASRRRVARSRGALSGLLLMILGLWAALVPFIGPYFDLAYTPRPDDAWHWTSARGWLEVLPGAAAFLGGLLLLMSASRAMTVFGGWLAALGGAWLVVGPPLADALNLDLGRPDPANGTNNQALTSLLFFFAVGAAILFFASLALGRVSVLSVRDVRAAERRAEAEEAERQAALEAAAVDERRRVEAERAGRHADHAAGPAADRDRDGVPDRDEPDHERVRVPHREERAEAENGPVAPGQPNGGQYRTNGGYQAGGTAGYPQAPTGPVQGGPVHGGPVQGGPVQGGPVHGGPVHGGPPPAPGQQYPAAPPPPREG
jgi:hypothetical protein